jgi:hypothetical protein
MHTFLATIRVGCTVTRTQVVADNSHNARLLLEKQYGLNSVIGFLQQVS